MYISLRRANALQSVIMETIANLPLTDVIQVGEFDNIAEVISVAGDQFSANFSARKSLWYIYYTLREAAAISNASVGISALLNEQVMLDRIITDLSEVNATSVVGNLSTLKAQQEKLQKRTDTSSYRSFETITTGVLSSDLLASAKAEIASLKKRKQAINDKLLELNVQTQIELDAEAEEILKSHNIL